MDRFIGKKVRLAVTVSNGTWDSFNGMFLDWNIEGVIYVPDAGGLMFIPWKNINAIQSHREEP